MKVKLINGAGEVKGNKQRSAGVNKTIERALRESQFNFSRADIVNVKRAKEGEIEDLLNKKARQNSLSYKGSNSYSSRCSNREIVLNFPEYVLNGYRDKYAPKYNGYEPKELLQKLGIDLNHKINSPERLNEYRRRYDDYFLPLFEKQDDHAIQLYLDTNKDDFNKLKPEEKRVIIRDFLEAEKQKDLRIKERDLSAELITFFNKAGIVLAIEDRESHEKVNFKYEKQLLVEMFNFAKSDKKYSGLSDVEILKKIGVA